MKRKYQKTKGYWVYALITPEKDAYIGMSKRQPCQRWQPSLYKTTALCQYIERFGWENIEHRVLIDNLTKQQAEQVEDWFVTKITEDGFCINSNRSGGIERDNRKEYDKARYQANREERKAYNKQCFSTPEGKIYSRVAAYNQTHTPIETPIEARTKYLEFGYIPSYIKNHDLI